MNEQLQAAQIVRRAEAEVQKLLVSSAGGGNYDAVTRLAELARQLRRLADKVEIGNGRVPRTGDGEASGADVSSAAAMPAPRPASRDDRPAHRAAKRGKIKPKGNYPRFCRDGDDLVKVGWSKKKKAEYRHKAPWEAVQVVVEAIEATGATGGRFNFDEILPIRLRDGSEVPSYQAYLALAWLRHENLITRHGRQGYSLTLTLSLMDAVEARWELLPQS